MAISRCRTNWTAEEITDLTALFEEGLPLNTISQRLRVSEDSVRNAIGRFDLAQGSIYDRRKEGIVRRLWSTRPGGSIAQAHRLQASEVRAIAARLNLGPEAPAYTPSAGARRRPWDAKTIAWARAVEKTGAETASDYWSAKIICGEMARRFPKEKAA